MNKPIIFCDFDGTITANDNIIAIMKKFDPPGWEPIKNQILDQSISIREGIAKMFSLLPVSAKDDVVSYVLDQAEIREGFRDFVDYVKTHELSLYIVSGGIDFFVYPLLKPFGPFDGIYCNSADFSKDLIHIEFPHGCDEICTSQGCGCCKPSIIRKLLSEGTNSIVIGDSISDWEAAKEADFVIARDLLADKCKEARIDYQPFETFHEVIAIVDKYIGVKS